MRAYGRLAVILAVCLGLAAAVLPGRTAAVRAGPGALEQVRMELHNAMATQGPTPWAVAHRVRNVVLYGR